jgi:hypothetical protein
MPVESPVRGDSHAGFGGRPAETERPKRRHRAAGRPYLSTDALDEIRREIWNEARRQGQTQLARELKGARFALWKNPGNLTERQARVGGHENLPVGGHRNAPLVAAISPHAWPRFLPTVLS